MEILLCIVYCMYRFVSLEKHIRILQLNHYQIDRFMKYLIRSTSYKKLILCALIHIPFLWLWMEQASLELCVLLLFVYVYIAFKYNSLFEIFSVIYTKRIIRLLCVLCLLYTTVVIWALHVSNAYWVLLGFMCVNKLMLLLAVCICAPIEKLLRNYYMRDAQKILAKNPKLMKVACIGSYGKTSTKNFIHALVNEDYYSLKSIASYNNVMGNTIMIRQYLKPIHDIYVCEMGSDHLGEIAQLMQFIKPQCVVLTSIGDQHLETFKTQENIVKEKTSCISYLRNQDLLIANVDNAYIRNHITKAKCRVLTFGQNECSDFRVCDIKVSAKGSRFTIVHKQQKIEMQTSLLGYYNIMNVCAGVVYANQLNISFTQIQKRVQQLKAVEHRMQCIEKDRYTFIDNGFNSNPLSFKNSLEVLSKMEEYTIFITPGLIDLKYDDEANFLAIQDAIGKVDEIVIVGRINKKALVSGLKAHSFTSYKCVSTMLEALQYIEELPRVGFVALVENDISQELMNP